MQAVRLNIHVLAYASKCHHDRRKKKCEAESAILETPTSAFKTLLKTYRNVEHDHKNALWK